MKTIVNGLVGQTGRKGVERAWGEGEGERIRRGERR
jgi:hypothetical protein